MWLTYDNTISSFPSVILLQSSELKKDNNNYTLTINGLVSNKIPANSYCHLLVLTKINETNASALPVATETIHPSNHLSSIHPTINTSIQPSIYWHNHPSILLTIQSTTHQSN